MFARRGAAQALAQPVGAIARRRADFIVLDGNWPPGCRPTLVDAAIRPARPVRDVAGAGHRAGDIRRSPDSGATQAVAQLVAVIAMSTATFDPHHRRASATMVEIRRTARSPTVRFGCMHDRWFGAACDLPRDTRAARTLMRGRWLTPGLIDCHTTVHAGTARTNSRRDSRVRATPISRRQRRIHGAPTRAASRPSSSREPAARGAGRRGDDGRDQSGYGLDTRTNPQLRAARRLAAAVGVDVRTTLLAAHAVPAEFAGRAGDYVDLVCRETIPAAADAACRCRRCVPRVDRLYTSDAPRSRRARAGRRSSPRRPVVRHGGAAPLPSSARRPITQYTGEAGVAARAAGTVAVLPGAFYAARDEAAAGCSIAGVMPIAVSPPIAILARRP
jgi:hypothetical protein